jgi:hypothetical protein
LKRAAKASGKRLRIVVFLRDDIYRLLQFEDKNKITDTGVAVAEWDAGDSELTLRGLMERRFGQVFNGHGTLPWETVFDENKEMPSRQTKYAHICSRTFLRPRDMIKFCNEVLAAHRRVNPEEPRFVNSDLIEARPDYSDYLLGELDDEIAKHVPEYRRYLEVVQSIGREIFDRDKFHEAWHKRPHLQDIDPDLALQQLFDFSIVGYLRTGGWKGGQKWTWRYLDPRPHRAILPADATTLRIHSGFKEALDLTKEQERNLKFPIPASDGSWATPSEDPDTPQPRQIRKTEGSRSGIGARLISGLLLRRSLPEWLESKLFRNRWSQLLPDNGVEQKHRRPCRRRPLKTLKQRLGITEPILGHVHFHRLAQMVFIFRRGVDLQALINRLRCQICPIKLFLDK